MGVEIAFVLPLDGGAGGELDGVIVLAVIFCLTGDRVIAHSDGLQRIQVLSG